MHLNVYITTPAYPTPVFDDQKTKGALYNNLYCRSQYRYLLDLISKNTNTRLVLLHCILNPEEIATSLSCGIFSSPLDCYKAACVRSLKFKRCRLVIKYVQMTSNL